MKKKFIPAMHYDCLTPFYGKFVDIFCGKRYVKAASHIKLHPGENLLDVGCGPGTILNLIHKMYPHNELTGLDIDPKILKYARKKLPGIKFHTSSATDIPEHNERFDVVISTMMIHHLPPDQKEKMIKEIYRVLKTGGRFYLMDFSPPTNWFGKIFTKIFRHAEHLDDAIEGKYPIWMEKVGFKNIKSIYRTYGMIEMLEGIK